MTTKSGVIGDNGSMDWFGEFNGASRVLRFGIGGIKIFFVEMYKINYFLMINECWKAYV